MSQIAFITGASSGIGAACAHKFAQNGYTLLLNARNREKLVALQTELETQYGVTVVLMPFDVRDRKAAASAIATLPKEYQAIDVLVNNFGTSNPKKDLDFAHTDITDYLDIVTLNLRSVFMASQAASKPMAKQGGGSIVNISSIGGLVPDISQVAYGSSKAAINYLTKLIAVQEATHHIRCNAVLPGMTATEAVEKHLSDEFRNLFMKHIPLGRMGLPEEIAEAVCYFASDASAYTTGQILTVSGGFGLGTPVYGDLVKKTFHR